MTKTLNQIWSVKERLLLPFSLLPASCVQNYICPLTQNIFLFNVQIDLSTTQILVKLFCTAIGLSICTRLSVAPMGLSKRCFFIIPRKFFLLIQNNKFDTFEIYSVFTFKSVLNIFLTFSRKSLILQMHKFYLFFQAHPVIFVNKFFCFFFYSSCAICPFISSPTFILAKSMNSLS